MNREGHRGFTLIELVVVVGLAGIIFTAGVAPLLFTVRSINETRRSFTDSDRERSAYNMIARDVREALMSASSPVRAFDSEELSTVKRRALAVRSAASSPFGEPIGTVIYAVPKESFGPDAKEPGLHRWTISGDVTASNIMELIDSERAQLILPDVDGFNVEFLHEDEWQEDHSGGVPAAMRVIFIYGRDERVYGAWFPNAQ